VEPVTKSIKKSVRQAKKSVRQAWGKIDYDKTKENMNTDNRVIRYENFSFSINFTFGGLKFKLICFAEQRSEFWTLTFVGDFSHVSFAESDPDSKAAIEKLFAPASGDFNALLKKSILNPVGAKIDGEHKSSLQYYGDFRGVVLARQRKSNMTSGSTVPQPENSEGWIKLGPTEAPSTEAQTLVVNTNVWSVGPSGSGSPVGRARSDGEFDRFVTGYAEQVVDELWPYLFETFSPDSTNKIEPNLAVTKILSRRLIHISSLGMAGSSLSDESKNSPVRFVLVTSTRNEWTLGHAIERVTNLGTMRLAALKHIQQLQGFSDELDRLNSEWQAPENALADRTSRATYIQNELQKAVNQVEGGVLDRISRSAYWADLFGQIQTGLGMDHQSDKTVGEFQSYDDFVRRRLGATFEFIKRLRVRYNNLHDAVKSHLDKVSAEDLQELRKGSATEVTSINLVIGSLETTVSALNDNSKEQKSLLDVADTVLPIVIWYHLGAILHYLGLDKWAVNFISNHPANDNGSHDSGGIFSFLFALAVTGFLFRRRLMALLKNAVSVFKASKSSDGSSGSDNQAT
jgi:hypothetical protein